MMSERETVEVAIGAIIDLRDGVWQVLITQRPSDVVLGGYWELPGGKLRAGETTADCVRRELAEEVGVDICVQQSLDAVDYDYDHGRIRLHPFYCALQRGQPHNVAVQQHRWVGHKQLAEYRFPPANVKLMTLIADELHRRDADALTTPSSHRRL